MRILIVEDQHKLAHILKKTLESEKYIVNLATNGNLGFDMASEEIYDLIILDIGLPDKNGLEITRLLRKNKILTPILMLTARDTIPDKIAGLDSGADDYMIKPFDFNELLARIRALNRKSSNQKSLELKISDLVLNTKTKTVKRANTFINLTSKEYSLLEYLMLNSGQIISREQIASHCWNENLDPFSNTIDVYIGYIRKKIDKQFPKQPALLLTIKNMGYKIG